MIRVAVCDDQEIILKGLKKILTLSQQVEVTGTYKNGNELLEGIAEIAPDVLLLDIQMPGQSGIELAGIICKKYPDIKIIALTNVDILQQVKKMLSQGCTGYLLKDANTETILEAIETVHQGEQFLHEPIRKQLLKSLSVKNSTILITRREKEVLEMIVTGLSNKEMAEKLNLSVRTIENHRNHLIQKLDVKNTAELVKTAIQQGLI